MGGDLRVEGNITSQTNFTRNVGIGTETASPAGADQPFNHNGFSEPILDVRAGTDQNSGSAIYVGSNYMVSGELVDNQSFIGQWGVNAYHYNRAAGDIIFGTSNTARMRLSSAGTLQPEGDGTQDLGASSKQWNNIYSEAGTFSGDITLTGTRAITNATSAGVLTLQGGASWPGGKIVLSGGNSPSTGDIKFYTGLSTETPTQRLVIAEGGAATFSGNVTTTGLKSTDWIEVRNDAAEYYLTNAANTRYWRQRIAASGSDYDYILDHYNGSGTITPLTISAAGTATFSGTLTGTTGNFSGNVFADNGIFAGGVTAGSTISTTGNINAGATLTAVTGTFSGNLSVHSSLTFSYNSYYFEAGTNSVYLKNGAGNTILGMAAAGVVVPSALDISGALTGTSATFSGIIQGGVTSTGGGVWMRQNYSGTAHHIGVIGNQYSTGAMTLGYAAVGKAGGSGYTSTLSNFSTSRSILQVGSNTLTFLTTAGAVQTAVGSDLTMVSRMSVSNTAATLTVPLTGTTGTFSGALTGTSATFSNNLTCESTMFTSEYIKHLGDDDNWIRFTTDAIAFSKPATFSGAMTGTSATFSGAAIGTTLCLGGSTAPATYKLHVTGTGFLSGGGYVGGKWTCSGPGSDSRLYLSASSAGGADYLSIQSNVSAGYAIRIFTGTGGGQVNQARITGDGDFYFRSG